MESLLIHCIFQLSDCSGILAKKNNKKKETNEVFGKVQICVRDLPHKKINLFNCFIYDVMRIEPMVA